MWVDQGNECGPVAHEQIVRVCNQGRVPLPKLLRLPLMSSPVSVAATAVGRGGATARVRTGHLGADRGAVDGGGGPGGLGEELESGSILAPLMEKLMETGHVEEFVEQVGGLLWKGWEGLGERAGVRGGATVGMGYSCTN